MNLKLASPKIMAISCLPQDYLFGGAEPQTLNKHSREKKTNLWITVLVPLGVV